MRKLGVNSIVVQTLVFFFITTTVLTIGDNDKNTLDKQSDNKNTKLGVKNVIDSKISDFIKISENGDFDGQKKDFDKILNSLGSLTKSLEKSKHTLINRQNDDSKNTISQDDSDIFARKRNKKKQVLKVSESETSEKLHKMLDLVKQKAMGLLDKAKTEKNVEKQEQYIQQSEKLTKFQRANIEKKNLQENPGETMKLNMTDDLLRSANDDFIEQRGTEEANNRLIQFFDLKMKLKKLQGDKYADNKEEIEELKKDITKVKNGATDFLHDPKKAFKTMIEKEKTKKKVLQIAEELISKEQKMTDPEKIRKINTFVEELIDHPNEILSKAKNNKKEIILGKAKEVAESFINRASQEKNEINKAKLLEQAKKILEHPLKTMKIMALRKDRARMLQRAPQNCKSWIRLSYGKKSYVEDEMGANSQLTGLAQTKITKSSIFSNLNQKNVKKNKSKVSQKNTFNKNELSNIIKMEIKEQFEDLKRSIIQAADKFTNSLGKNSDKNFDKEKFYIFPKAVFDNSKVDKKVKRLLFGWINQKLTNKDLESGRVNDIIENVLEKIDKKNPKEKTKKIETKKTKRKIPKSKKIQTHHSKIKTNIDNKSKQDIIPKKTLEKDRKVPEKRDVNWNTGSQLKNIMGLKPHIDKEKKDLKDVDQSQTVNVDQDIGEKAIKDTFNAKITPKKVLKKESQIFSEKKEQEKVVKRPYESKPVKLTTTQNKHSGLNLGQDIDEKPIKDISDEKIAPKKALQKETQISSEKKEEKKVVKNPKESKPVKLIPTQNNHSSSKDSPNEFNYNETINLDQDIGEIDDIPQEYKTKNLDNSEKQTNSNTIDHDTKLTKLSSQNIDKDIDLINDLKNPKEKQVDQKDLNKSKNQNELKQKVKINASNKSIKSSQKKKLLAKADTNTSSTTSQAKKSQGDENSKPEGVIYNIESILGFADSSLKPKKFLMKNKGSTDDNVNNRQIEQQDSQEANTSSLLQ